METWQYRNYPLRRKLSKSYKDLEALLEQGRIADYNDQAQRIRDVSRETAKKYSEELANQIISEESKAQLLAKNKLKLGSIIADEAIDPFDWSGKC